MNVLDCEVKKVKSKPYQIDPPKFWFVDVEYNCYGSLATTSVMLKTEEEAELVKVGYIFQG